MLRIVKSEWEIKECQERLEDVLNKKLSRKGQGKEFHIDGGWSSPPPVQYNESIWFVHYKYTADDRDDKDRFWNGFGLTCDLEKDGPSKIVVEINIPTDRVDRAVGGMFAIDDETESIFLLHRGGIKKVKGIKDIKDIFADWSSWPVEKITNDSKVEEGFCIGNLSNDDFVENLVKFVQKVSEFKLFLSRKTD